MKQLATSFFNYLNNVDSYGNHVAFTKNDILLKKGSSTKVATVSAISHRRTHIQVNLL